MRLARLKAGLSQEDMALKLRRTQTYVSKLERGAQGLEIVEFLDYCAAIDANPGQMLNGVLEDERRILDSMPDINQIAARVVAVATAEAEDAESRENEEEIPSINTGIDSET